MIYPFVQNAKLENVQRSIAWRIHERLEEVGSFKKLRAEEQTECETIFGQLWHYDAYKSGRYKLGGFVFDFRPWMKTYWVKLKYHGIVEMYSFNKTTIRKWSTNPSYIEKIVEIKGNQAIEEDDACESMSNNSITDDTKVPCAPAVK